MSWLDRIAKGAQESVNRATNEADRAIKLTRVTTEINGKRGELDRAYALIGHAVWELHQNGSPVPDGLSEQFAGVEALNKQLLELEAQREALRLNPTPPGAPASGAPPSTPAGGPAMEGTVIDSDPPRQQFCGGCGAALQAGAKFCINCGRPTG